jgi:hypothetical protein
MLARARKRVNERRLIAQNGQIEIVLPNRGRNCDVYFDPGCVFQMFSYIFYDRRWRFHKSAILAQHIVEDGHLGRREIRCRSITLGTPSFRANADNNRYASTLARVARLFRL